MLTVCLSATFFPLSLCLLDRNKQTNKQARLNRGSCSADYGDRIKLMLLGGGFSKWSIRFKNNNANSGVSIIYGGVMPW